MPGPDLRARIGVDGEQEFRQVIREINTDLGITWSEMRKVTAQYQENADSIEALTAKGEALEKQLTSQREKVEEMQAALQHAVEAYGEGSEEALEWTKSLNNAEAQVYNTEAAIRKNNEALEQAKNGMQEVEEETQSFGDVLDVVSDKLGIKLPKELTKAADNFGHFSLKSVAAVAAVTGAVVGLEKTYERLFDLTKEAAANADNILTLSQITGLDTDTIQEMRYAAEFIDVAFEQIQSSLTKLKNNMQDTRDGNEKLSEAFRKLGVQVTNEDGTLRNAKDVFYDVIDALGQVENATERDTLAMDLFGRSAEQLNPLIIQGSDRLRELAAEAENVGYVMSGEVLDALGAVDDAYQRMQRTQEGLTQQISGQMAPAVTNFYETWTELMAKAGKALTDSRIIQGLGEILTGATSLLDPLSALLGIIPGLEGELHPLYTILHSIAGVLAWISDAGNAVIGLLTGFTASGRERFNTALGLNARYGQYSNMQRWSGQAQQWEDWRGSSHSGYSGQNYGYDASTGQYYDKATGNYIYNAAGNLSFAGGRTWVGENGPEEVELPAGTRIYNAQETAQRSSGDVFIFNIDAKNVRELNQLVDMAKSARLERRMR